MELHEPLGDLPFIPITPVFVSTQLPAEVVYAIMKNFSTHDLLTCRLVSRVWKSLASKLINQKNVWVVLRTGYFLPTLIRRVETLVSSDYKCSLSKLEIRLDFVRQLNRGFQKIVDLYKGSATKLHIKYTYPTRYQDVWLQNPETFTDSMMSLLHQLLSLDGFSVCTSLKVTNLPYCGINIFKRTVLCSTIQTLKIHMIREPNEELEFENPNFESKLYAKITSYYMALLKANAKIITGLTIELDQDVDQSRTDEEGNVFVVVDPNSNFLHSQVFESFMILIESAKLENLNELQMGFEHIDNITSVTNENLLSLGLLLKCNLRLKHLRIGNVDMKTEAAITKAVSFLQQQADSLEALGINSISRFELDRFPYMPNLKILETAYMAELRYISRFMNNFPVLEALKLKDISHYHQKRGFRFEHIPNENIKCLEFCCPYSSKKVRKTADFLNGFPAVKELSIDYVTPDFTRRLWLSNCAVTLTKLSIKFMKKIRDTDFMGHSSAVCSQIRAICPKELTTIDFSINFTEFERLCQKTPDTSIANFINLQEAKFSTTNNTFPASSASVVFMMLTLKKLNLVKLKMPKTLLDNVDAEIWISRLGVSKIIIEKMPLKIRFDYQRF